MNRNVLYKTLNNLKKLNNAWACLRPGVSVSVRRSRCLFKVHFFIRKYTSQNVDLIQGNKPRFIATCSKC